jgi:hypothetical protein
MKNRAKCRLCKDILESFHRYDYVTCKCGEISIDGGNDFLHCSAKDFANFMRVDDEGHEILVKLVEKSQQEDPIEPGKPTRNEKIEMLEIMIKNIENLPQSAMNLPINHYDLCSFMVLIASILKEEK